MTLRLSLLMSIMFVAFFSVTAASLPDDGVLPSYTPKDYPSDQITLVSAALRYDNYQNAVFKEQSPSDIFDEIKEAKTWDELISVKTALMSFLIMVGGWLSAFIPGLKSIPSSVYRVLAFAILFVAGVVLLGFGDIWQGAIAYFFSTSLYEVVVKWIAPSPKPKSV